MQKLKERGDGIGKPEKMKICWVPFELRLCALSVFVLEEWAKGRDPGYIAIVKGRQS